MTCNCRRERRLLSVPWAQRCKCVCDFSAPELRINIACESPSFASQLFLRMIKQCAHLLGHIKSHAIFPIYFLSSCGIARARERCATNTSTSNAHWGDHKSSRALPSAAGRQWLQQLKTLTHTRALSSRWKRASPWHCTHLFFIIHTYSACSAYALVRAVPQRRRLHLQLILSAPLI